ncbi:LysR family transcriptional regulator [Pseudorhodoferax sp. LjRoot39]|uniref:LysR family transcriptional regulator n=1 Tax=Pseudorhodoferax sp. LjRoot39 TaxID=3342328 RepID=UPI003ECF0523
MAAIRFTLRQLQYFVTVARTGQISAAAAEANVTQSTMTAAIAELERALDTLLFERSRTGAALTYQGHLFLQHAHAVLEAAADAARHPFRERSDVQGTIELAASYTVLGYFLLPFIAKFQKQHPDVRVVPVERDRAQIESNLGSGQIELAVALTSNLQDNKRFHRRALARSRRQLWVADGHPLTESPQVRLREVSQHPYVVPTVDEGEASAMGYWTQAGVQPSSQMRTSSMEAVREMVALGLGVTILSDMVFRPWSLDGRRICTVPLADPVPPMEVGLIWLKGRKLSPIAEVLRKYLEVAVGPRGL